MRFLATCAALLPVLLSGEALASEPRSAADQEFVDAWDRYKEALSRQIERNEKDIRSTNEATEAKAREAKAAMEKAAADVVQDSIEGIAKDLGKDKAGAVTKGFDSLSNFAEVAKQSRAMLDAELELALDDNPEVAELRAKNAELRKNIALATSYVNTVMATGKAVNSQAQQAEAVEADARAASGTARAVGDRREHARAAAERAEAERRAKEKRDRERRESNRREGEPRGGDRDPFDRDPPDRDPPDRDPPDRDPPDRDPPDRGSDGPSMGPLG